MDGSRAGAKWFTIVMQQASSGLSGFPNTGHCRSKLPGEIFWGVYEDNLGPRPLQYDLYDQLRLQFPEAVEGLTIESAKFDRERHRSTLTLRGFPKSVHDITFSVGRRHTGSEIVVETRDHQRWASNALSMLGEGLVVMFEAVKN